jgi:hypothetical protein
MQTGLPVVVIYLHHCCQHIICKVMIWTWLFPETADLTARILRHLDKQEKRDITRQAIAACLKTI